MLLMERNQSVDLVKIIAMIMIVWMHVGFIDSLAMCWPFKFVFGLLTPAIPLFFMVSGYLMQGKMPTYKYVFRKILNILKYVYTFIIISSIVMSAKSGHLPKWNILYEWFLQRGFYSIFWYLGAMIYIYIYILAPVVCKIISSSKARVALIIMLLICTIVVILNVSINFEQQYIRQTFRIWTWLFYFMLGAYIKQYGCSKHISWFFVLIMMATAAMFIIPSITHSSFEYLYGSVVCVLYAYCIFCACLNTDVRQSKIISALSSVFLPVYSFHVYFYLLTNMLVKNYVSIDMIPASLQGSICFVVVLTVSIVFSLLITRIPYVKNLFKI